MIKRTGKPIKGKFAKRRVVRKIIRSVVDGVVSVGVSAIVLSMLASAVTLSYQPKQAEVPYEPIEYYKQIKYPEVKSNTIEKSQDIALASYTITKETAQSAAKLVADINTNYTAQLSENETKEATSISRKAEEREIPQDALLKIDDPDPNYTGRIVELSAEDKDFVLRLVQGEAGAEGYEGAALVAQAIRDTMIEDGYTVKEVYTNLKYTGKLTTAPNENVKKAVEFIFDKGGSAVQHRIIYFYAPALVASKFHETQEFVIEHNGHRVFDRR